VHVLVIWTLGPRNIERAVKVFSAVQIACVVALLVWALKAAPLDRLFAVSSNVSSSAVAAVGQLCSARNSNASVDGAAGVPSPEAQAAAAAAAVALSAAPLPSSPWGLAQAYRMSKGVTAIVSGWSTMALNIADLSRCVRTPESSWFPRIVRGKSSNNIIVLQHRRTRIHTWFPEVVPND
jgi:cytosine/uracil/thiamine/allantoin permease